jgi:small subunit ribosomal protein S7
MTGEEKKQTKEETPTEPEPKKEKASEKPQKVETPKVPPKKEDAKPAKEDKETEVAAPPKEMTEEKPTESKEQKKETAPEEKKEPALKETPEKPPDKPQKKPADTGKKEAPKEKTPEKAVEKPKEDPKKPEKKEEKPQSPKRMSGIPPDMLLLFGKYDVSEVVVSDAGLAKYINLDPISVPHSGAKHANRPFAKGKVHIVERLVNNMMRTETNTGKKTKTYRIVMKAFEIVNSKTKKNPVQVFIDAVQNTTPREEVTRLRYGGVSVPKAVDTSSARRLDVAIRNICKGAVSATHKNTKPVELCLANEIMLAAKGDMNSYAVAKKEEVERIAGSAR